MLAEREGVDPVSDRRPRLLTAMIGALVFLANRECEGGDDPEAMAAAFDAYADEITPTLAGHWVMPGGRQVAGGRTSSSQALSQPEPAGGVLSQGPGLSGPVPPL